MAIQHEVKQRSFAWLKLFGSLILHDAISARKNKRQAQNNKAVIATPTLYS